MDDPKAAKSSPPDRGTPSKRAPWETPAVRRMDANAAEARGAKSRARLDGLHFS